MIRHVYHHARIYTGKTLHPTHARHATQPARPAPQTPLMTVHRVSTEPFLQAEPAYAPQGTYTTQLVQIVHRAIPSARPVKV